MNKTIRILLLSVVITILAAACGSSQITLEDTETVQTTDSAEAADPAQEDSGTPEDAAATEAADTSLADTDRAQAAGTDDEIPARVCVYVCGEVNTPGVYELAEGARIYEALTLAGGLTADADITIVNQAQTLTDGMMIRIPAIGESAEETPVLSGTDTAAAGSTAADTGLVNINTADVTTLTTLPGIGASKAAAIVEYREQNGRYTNKEDLLNVSGIGDATYRNLESQITVGP